MHLNVLPNEVSAEFSRPAAVNLMQGVTVFASY